MFDLMPYSGFKIPFPMLGLPGTPNSEEEDLDQLLAQHFGASVGNCSTHPGVTGVDFPPPR